MSPDRVQWKREVPFLAWFAFLVAIVSGAANPVQSAAHGQLHKQLQQTVWAGIVIYTIGLLGMFAIQAFVREPSPFGHANQVSWWAWTGGLLSIASTMAALIFVQKLGSGLFTGIGVTASLVVSVLIDKFGVLGMKQHPATPGRLIGCALLIAGVWLVARF